MRKITQPKKKKHNFPITKPKVLIKNPRKK